MISTHQVETLVVGGGIIGSSVAMHLAQLGNKDVRVIDLDLEGTWSSTELNAGGVRATWNQPINIQMSVQSIRYFSTVAQEVGYRPCGYLWLHSPTRLEQALSALSRQHEYGWTVEVWDLAQLQRRVPFIDKHEGIAGILYAPQDGLINPNLLKAHYRKKAKLAGARFDDRIWLNSVEVSSHSEFPIKVAADYYGGFFSEENKHQRLLQEDFRYAQKQPVTYHAKRVVNCAGPWGAAVAKKMGYESPSFPIRRQVSVFESKDVDLSPYGMIVDTSGVYFHPEGGHGLAGWANPQEMRGANYSYDGEEFFVQHIWGPLWERSSHFERLKHLGGWAGLYDVSPDEAAILGEVQFSEKERQNRFFEAHSFSGHGIMHSYSAGLALAERIIYGHYISLNASALDGKRFAEGKLLPENLVI